MWGDVRGGEFVAAAGYTVSRKAIGQWADTVGHADKWEIMEWLKNNAPELKRMADGSPYYVRAGHGFRFACIRNEHLADPGHFILVSVERVHAKE